MSQWTPTYSPKQRQAIIRAYVELRIRPVSAICGMARAGELRPDADAEPLEPFDLPDSTARQIGRQAERRKAGEELRPNIARLPARDRAELFQRRLTALIDAELTRLEDHHRRKRQAPLDAEQVRKLARALRELGTVPDPADMRLPRTPGDRVPGSGARPDSPTGDDLSGKLLRASARHATSSSAARETPTGDTAGEETPGETQAPAENTPAAAPAEPADTTPAKTDEDERAGGASGADVGLAAELVRVG